MRIYNVVEIYDNDEFATVTTKTGVAIHLPLDGKHSITVLPYDNDNPVVIVNIDLNQG